MVEGQGEIEAQNVRALQRAKQRRIVRLLGAFSLAFHAIQATHFFARGYSTVGAVNVGSVAFYVLALILISRGLVGLGTLVMGIELLVYLTWAALHFGFEAGFYWYYLTITTVTFMIFRGEQRKARWAWRFVFIVSGALVTWVSLTTGLLDEAFIDEIYAINVITNVAVLWAGAGYFAWTSERAEAEAEAQRFRADTLLNSMLPVVIADRLKSGEKTIADQSDNVTVLFSDIVGFTQLSSRVSTQELIEILNDIFSRFDRIAKECGVEKIKTIGDAYMAVAGIPEAAPDHAERAAKMALGMQCAITEFREQSHHEIDVRIGLHSGEVIAGVIGEEKPAYDLWGDAVNCASRMESHGEQGRVQISEATYNCLRDAPFDITARGTIEVKGKGPMKTYWLDAHTT